MNAFEPITGLLDVALRLLAATLIGGALGLNRELRDKPAGLRTHALVSLGAALMTITAILFAFDGTGVDGNPVTRVIQGIVAGIGFLGAGVILQTQAKNVVGLTTAATIWLVAALGISCGAGHWQIALVALLFSLLALMGGSLVERSLEKYKQPTAPDDSDDR
jgi:putative Mg2+ transporter-C (MgtC) family protein